MPLFRAARILGIFALGQVAIDPEPRGVRLAAAPGVIASDGFSGMRVSSWGNNIPLTNDTRRSATDEQPWGHTRFSAHTRSWANTRS